MQRIVLFKTNEPAGDLRATEYYRVLDSHRICPPWSKDECWAVDIDNKGVDDPASDPMLIGLTGPLYDYASYDGPVTRVVWRDALWTPASSSQMDVLLKLADAVKPQK